jgi:hypothetical protein
MKKYYTDEQLDVGPYLLTCIFDRAWGHTVGFCHWSDEKSKQVEGTFRVFEWLGLVEPDDSSHLGFKPTHVLMKNVMARGEQLHTLKRPPSYR